MALWVQYLSEDHADPFDFHWLSSGGCCRPVDELGAWLGSSKSMFFQLLRFFVGKIDLGEALKPAGLTNSHHDYGLSFHLASIISGSLLFTVYGVIPETISNDSNQISKLVDQPNYRQKAEIIGTIETQSEFINSEYGDNLLFFRHQRLRTRIGIIMLYYLFPKR